TKLLKTEATEKPTTEKGADPVSEKLSKVFEIRFEQYKGNLESLNTYLWFQLIFIVAAAVAISTKSDSFKVPVIDKEVPVKWALVAIPVCLLYFWLRYRFTLNELIDARTVPWKVNEAMTSTAITNKVELSKALYTFSHVPATYDGGYLDGWFITFEPLKYTLT